MGRMIELAKAAAKRIDVAGCAPVERRLLEEAGFGPETMVAVDRVKQALAQNGGGTVVGVWVGQTPAVHVGDGSDRLERKVVLEVEAATETLAELVPPGWTPQSRAERLVQLASQCEAVNPEAASGHRGTAAAIRLARSIVSDGTDTSA